MNIKEIMTSKVIFISEEASIYEAAKLMREKDIGSLIVLKGKSLSGIITDRDIVMYFAKIGRLNECVKNVMSKPVHFANINDSLVDLADKMGYFQIKRIPIVENNKIVGIVSTSDLVRNRLGKIAFSTLSEITYDPTRVYFQSYQDYLSDNIS